MAVGRFMPLAEDDASDASVSNASIAGSIAHPS